MTIEEIYKKYNIHLNLQRHMLRVASLTKIICTHWIGPSIDKASITKAALLHDIGNLIKCDFKKFPEMLTEETEDSDYWINVQKKFISKYGNDEHLAVLEILEELNIDTKVREMLKDKDFRQMIKLQKSNDWNSKIIKYADTRISPFGIVSLKERLEEAEKRYKGNNHSTINAPNYKDLVKAAFKLEKDIQENTDINIYKVNNKQIEKDFALLKKTKF